MVNIKFKNLKVGECPQFCALVVDYRLSYTVNGTPYYSLVISDGTDNADARIWSTSIIDNLEKGKVYFLETKINDYAGKKQIIINKISAAPSDVNLEDFYRTAPISEQEIREGIKKYIKRIENTILKNIVVELIKENEEKFFTYPAAMTMHHNYMNGLGHHTYSMLKLADGYLENYPSLNKDLLYAGILIHDIGKTVEFTEVRSPEYSIDGNLLGHIVIGIKMLHEMALKLNYIGTEEVLALEHLIVSHHGELEHGSPKIPMMAEAYAIYFLDLTDSKLNAMNTEISKTDKGERTSPIPTIDRKTLYVPKI